MSSFGNLDTISWWQSNLVASIRNRMLASPRSAFNNTVLSLMPVGGFVVATRERQQNLRGNLLALGCFPLQRSKQIPMLLSCWRWGNCCWSWIETRYPWHLLVSLACGWYRSHCYSQWGIGLWHCVQSCRNRKMKQMISILGKYY